MKTVDVLGWMNWATSKDNHIQCAWGSDAPDELKRLIVNVSPDHDHNGTTADSVGKIIPNRYNVMIRDGQNYLRNHVVEGTFENLIIKITRWIATEFQRRDEESKRMSDLMGQYNIELEIMKNTAESLKTDQTTIDKLTEDAIGRVV